MSEKLERIMEAVCADCRYRCTIGGIEEACKPCMVRSQISSILSSPEDYMSGKIACHRLINNGIRLTTEDARELEKIIRDLLAVVEEQRVENGRAVIGLKEFAERSGDDLNHVRQERDEARAEAGKLRAELAASKGKVVKGFTTADNIGRVIHNWHFSSFTIMEYKGQGWDVPVTLIVQEDADGK